MLPGKAKELAFDTHKSMDGTQKIMKSKMTQAKPLYVILYHPNKIAENVSESVVRESRSKATSGKWVWEGLPRPAKNLLGVMCMFIIAVMFPIYETLLKLSGPASLILLTLNRNLSMF